MNQQQYSQKQSLCSTAFISAFNSDRKQTNRYGCSFVFNSSFRNKKKLFGMGETKGSRLERIKRLYERIKNNENQSKQNIITKPNLPKQLPKPNQKTLDQLFMEIIWIDNQLKKIINLFPSQYKQLEQRLPCKQLRPLLKLINTMIAIVDKEVKNDDTLWKQHAIYMLEKGHKEWGRRWEIQQYTNLVFSNRSKHNQTKSQNICSQINSRIEEMLNRYQIEKDTILVRGLIMRYLIDIDY